MLGAYRSIWRACTCNVCSMVDTKISIEVASQGTERGEDRKVDQVVSELAQYDRVVGALQETKWFGYETYEVSESMVLTSGRRTLTEGETVQREERVALVLREQALAAWRRGGQQWKAWSSRCVSAVLQVDKICKCLAMHPPEQQAVRTRMISSRSLDALFPQCH